MSRRAEIERNTKETKIKIALELDGTGKAELHSGIGFSITCWMDLQDTDFLILQ